MGKISGLICDAILCLILFLVCGSCVRSSNTEKHQKKRANIIDISERVTKIEMEEVPITDFADPYILDDYLIVTDYKSPDKLIHILDKNTFRYLASTGEKGQGPGEIANLGRVGINESERAFYVTDHGKQIISIFYIDSVLINPFYSPAEKIYIDENLYPYRYMYVNDTLAIGLFSKVLNPGDYMPIVARWNMKTGEVRPMKYLKHPEIERKRVSFAASIENGLYVECYWYHDLMTIGYLNGEFECNIYGNQWNSATSKNGYYDNVVFCKDKIVASYLGEKRLLEDSIGGVKAVYPTKLMVFDKEGNYLLTLETGHPITIFCYDNENNRIIMTLNDDMLFAYLSLDGLIE